MTSDGRDLSEIERLMQEGEVGIDSPDVTCVKVGHAWGPEVCNDGTPAAFYSRECRRCGRAEVAPQPSGPWQGLDQRFTWGSGDVVIKRPDEPEAGTRVRRGNGGR